MRIVFLFTLFVTSVGLAQTRPYGTAGCGLGSVVVGSDGNQIVAATTNATGLQTFGISSGTSNCVQDGAVQEANKIPLFIEINKLSLAKEASRGEGEVLSNLAYLYGCDGQHFSAAVKENYQAIFVETNMSPRGIQNTLDTIAFDQACDQNSKLTIYKNKNKQQL